MLGDLRAGAGLPSYRSLARQVGPFMRPARVVSPSTVADAFKVGRRRLDLDLVVAIVRALGLDRTEAARWRDAWMRVHAGAKSAIPFGAPRQLPADIRAFTGRHVEMETITKAAAHAAGAVTIVAIGGLPGAGKTRLALHTAHALVRDGGFQDVQLYADLHGFDADRQPADPASVLDGFLRALGIPANRIPESIEGRAATFRSALAGQAALIVLDNVSDENQVNT